MGSSEIVSQGGMSAQRASGPYLDGIIVGGLLVEELSLWPEFLGSIAQQTVMNDSGQPADLG